MKDSALLDLIMGYRKAKLVSTAAWHDLFTPLERPLTSKGLARLRRLDPRAAEIALDGLAAIGLVRKEGGRYRNSPTASRRLVRGRQGYFGSNLKYQELIWDAWGDLRSILRSGRPRRSLSSLLAGSPSFSREYIEAMDDLARGVAAEVSAGVPGLRSGRMLDVGAGPGAYARALMSERPGLCADLLDLPSTLKVTRRVLARFPEFSGRLRLLPGDYRSASFGRNRYDLVLMSHITHDEPPAVNRRLVAKALRALKPGGLLAVHDFVVDETRARPEFGALFSVHMLTYTQGGRTYTASEYQGWMRKAGFEILPRRRIGRGAANETTLILGRRPF